VLAVVSTCNYYDYKIVEVEWFTAPAQVLGAVEARVTLIKRNGVIDASANTYDSLMDDDMSPSMDARFSRNTAVFKALIRNILHKL